MRKCIRSPATCCRRCVMRCWLEARQLFCVLSWAHVRDFLAQLSRDRATQGYTPSETATFVFSLKRPLFARVSRELQNDSNALAAEIWYATELLDILGLFTTETFQKSREEVVERQQQELLELSTPVVELWQGILALPLIGTLVSSRTQIVMRLPCTLGPVCSGASALRSRRPPGRAIDRSMKDLLDASQRQTFGFVVAAARRMSALIADVLSYSRVGRESTEFGAVRLQDVVNWALRNLGESLNEAKADIQTGQLPVVWGDWSQLTQLIQNLVGNAIKYRNPNIAQKISIDAELRSEGEWVITVTDNGIGIDPGYHDQIFGIFKRLHGTDIPGTGIGLALCRRIVETHVDASGWNRRWGRARVSG